VVECLQIISVHRVNMQKARLRSNRCLHIDTEALTTHSCARLSGIDLPRPSRDDFDLVLFLDANVPSYKTACAQMKTIQTPREHPSLTP